MPSPASQVFTPTQTPLLRGAPSTRSFVVDRVGEMPANATSPIPSPLGLATPNTPGIPSRNGTPSASTPSGFPEYVVDDAAPSIDAEPEY
jgi:hypothetical protein